ncbi:hypothetical protein J2Z66_000155 [Paenibacillus eucommiae]|uniref:Uncharacterized protein n=1 Tax=Paenibacillus eucommiae TaxID=1355755 RepID=A0ABS4ILW7_9BACL|nr:hypothetical protein [Paenibacillus eucommiae]
MRFSVRPGVQTVCDAMPAYIQGYEYAGVKWVAGSKHNDTKPTKVIDLFLGFCYTLIELIG